MKHEIQKLPTSVPTPKRLPNQKWLFWQSSHLPQSADTQASPNFEKVQISSRIDSFYQDDTFRSGHTKAGHSLHLTRNAIYARCFAITTLIMTSLSVVGQDLKVLTKLPDILHETSGIEITTPNRIWSFNDSGGEPELYLFDTMGNLIKNSSY